MLVVGAGPCGLALALRLARAGVAVTLVEASATPERAFRGEALMPSGLAALERLGLADLPTDTVPQRPLGGWSFSVNGAPLFAVPEPLGSPPACRLLDQGALLGHWLQQAQRQPTLELLQGVAVRNLLWSPPDSGQPPRVVGVELADGRVRSSVLVIGCDGRGSLVRQRANLPLQEATAVPDVLWFRISSAAWRPIGAGLQGHFHTAIGHPGTMALYERARGGVQLGWALAAGERPTGSSADWIHRFAAAAPAALAPQLAAVPPDDLEGPLRLPVRVGMVQHWQRPGVLLLGDAAHPMSPVRAQGLNMALRDALVAAEQLLPVLQQPPAHPTDALGPQLDPLLAEIEALRRPEVERIQALQRQETERGERLRRNPWLRQLLAASGPWSQGAMAAFWAGQQGVLRQGLPLPAPSS